MQLRHGGRNVDKRRVERHVPLRGGETAGLRVVQQPRHGFQGIGLDTGDFVFQRCQVDLDQILKVVAAGLEERGFVFVQVLVASFEDDAEGFWLVVVQLYEACVRVLTSRELVKGFA